MSDSAERPAPEANPGRFFALALGISWLSWAAVILLRLNVWEFPAVLFGAVGLFGPALAEVVLILRTRDRARWRDYWERVFDYRRIGKRWHLVIWLTFPTVNVLAIWLSRLSGSPPPTFETARGLLAAPWRILPFALFILLFGPLPEELGWRGYALDGLQARYNALTSSLILGAMWALWHVPLFFMPGTYQHDQLRFGSPDFWAYLAGPVVISVLFTWIYNNTRRSTLSAILFHFMANFTGELLPLSGRGGLYSTLLLAGASALVVAIWGAESLTGRPALRGFFGKGVCPYRFAFILDHPGRRLILSPQALADRLHLTEETRVLEIGPGAGYFSVEVARRVPRGHLTLLDLQPEMLQMTRRKLARSGLIRRTGIVQGDAVHLPFDGDSFDVVFLVAVLGEVPDPAAGLREVARVLRPGGLLSITEQPGDPDFTPLPTVRSLAERHGLAFAESYGRGRNYTANFRKASRR